MKSFLIFALCLLNGCDSPSESGDGPHIVRIVASTDEGYHLRNVEIRTLVDLKHMEGLYSAILGDASLNADAGIEEFISPAARDELYIDKGKKVRLDFEKKGDVIHPKNFDSMAMLAMYYNYENTIEFWRDNLNLDVKDFGQLRLFYAPRIKREISGGTFEGTVKVNAAFLPGPRDFFFFKTSRIELLPINMNFGVMAHEFSHAIFDYQFAGTDASIYTTDNFQSETRLRAINEGVADYFSYMVTERVEEFGESLATLKEFRTLPVFWNISNVAQSGCRSEAYCDGSLFASALYEVAISENQNAVEVGQRVYSALSKLREDWITNSENGIFDYYHFINRVLDEVAANNGNISLYCEKFLKYFNSVDIVGQLNRCNAS